MPNMIEVQIDSVRVHLMTPQRVVVLKQIDAERYLTIWVGLTKRKRLLLPYRKWKWYAR